MICTVKVIDVNVGNRYIEFYVDDEKDSKFLTFVQEVVRALEDEMHTIAKSHAYALQKDFEFEMDQRNREMKEIFREMLAEFGHDISLDEIDSIFKTKLSERLPF